MTHLDPEIESVILLLWGIPEEEEEVDPFSVPYRAQSKKMTDSLAASRNGSKVSG